MLLPIQTFKFKHLKVLALSLFLGLLTLNKEAIFAKNSVSNRPNKSAKKGKKTVNPFDTLFCENKAVAKVMKIKMPGDSFPTSYFYHLKDTGLLLSVKPTLISNASRSGQADANSLYFHFEFPNIQMNADYKSKGNQNEIKSVICYADLVNANGLDTLKSEIFATINGNIQTQLVKKVDAEKLFIVERNKSAEIKIEELEISQDGILLGRYEEEELEGTDGKFIQYSIFNSTGALVCTASKVKFNKDQNKVQWNLLTQRDMRFSTTELKLDNDLIELLKYLVQKSII